MKTSTQRLDCRKSKISLWVGGQSKVVEMFVKVISAWWSVVRALFRYVLALGHAAKAFCVSCCNVVNNASDSDTTEAIGFTPVQVV